MILSVATAALILLGTGYLRDLLRTPPKYLVSALFCFGSVPVLILCILHRRNPRLIAAGIALLALIVLLFVTFRNGISRDFNVSIGLSPETYPVTEEWTAELEDPGNGTVTVTPGDGIIGPACRVTIKDINRPTGIILKDPEGNTYVIPLVVEQDGTGIRVSY